MGAFMTVIADPVIGGTYMTVGYEPLYCSRLNDRSEHSSVFICWIALEHTKQLWRNMAAILCP